ncbi:GNAT family N-acetyltransferase/peptidase C39 family protein [Methylophaga sp. OBS4]|uniref:GNAT family N-acetyltransferase/peptidase C39 family protein n=1 Tax=Methylophaga sp. OBS4 TaxID=2991935 RepID=UPI00224FA3BB|nr:GNAT family N-acetyltransferase/peptidase C39 family protein [Methylophaga sp. OBS4]MCX4187968.1 GNAT family N-acetyltransferase/peptidase C39 family protein [Methylophaga sp. OBS4]
MAITTDAELLIREATLADVDALSKLENQCFDSDRLSRRSFKWMIDKGHTLLLTAMAGDTLAGYVLLLYSRGTSLGRVYSLAVSQPYRKLGVAAKLMAAAETRALDAGRSFLRLEVRPDNMAAIRLYEKLGYQPFDIVSDFYEDHADALRMMKVLHHLPEITHPQVAHYSQTTDFTCGSACLMMALKAFAPDTMLDRKLELQLWREATTIFMTSGHGGCSPQGLALAAFQRGLNTTLICNSDEIPFINGVRSEDKKAVIECVHQNFIEQINNFEIEQQQAAVDVALLRQYLDQGALALVLISSYRLNQSKSPHWVLVVSVSDTFVYFHDPDVDWDDNKSITDSGYIPVTHKEFNRMSGYGKPRYQAAVMLKQA